MLKNFKVFTIGLFALAFISAWTYRDWPVIKQYVYDHTLQLALPKITTNVPTPLKPVGWHEVDEAPAVKQPVGIETEKALSILNGIRAEKKLPKLAISPSLSRSATTFAEYLATVEEITNRDRKGHDAWDRAEDEGYKPEAIRQSVAAGQSDIATALKDLLSKPRNKSYVDDREMTEVGFGIVHNTNTPHHHYYVIVYARPKSGL